MQISTFLVFNVRDIIKYSYSDDHKNSFTDLQKISNVTEARVFRCREFIRIINVLSVNSNAIKKLSINMDSSTIMCATECYKYFVLNNVKIT